MNAFSYVLFVRFLCQVVEGLQMQALDLLRSATTNAEEEELSFSLQHLDMRGSIEAYMTLVNFCDRRLRESEQKEERKRELRLVL